MIQKKSENLTLKNEIYINEHIYKNQQNSVKKKWKVENDDDDRKNVILINLNDGCVLLADIKTLKMNAVENFTIVFFPNCHLPSLSISCSSIQ